MTTYIKYRFVKYTLSVSDGDFISQEPLIVENSFYTLSLREKSHFSDIFMCQSRKTKKSGLKLTKTQKSYRPDF